MKNDSYSPIWGLKNGHVNTIWPNLFRTVNGIDYKRKRFELDDGDFIDLDVTLRKNKTCVLLMHGLEGDSKRPYMQGMASICLQNKCDIIAMNHRGCSGEPNRLITAYHSGKTDDLAAVLRYIEEQYCYKNIIIVGFSLSGNLILKYAGEHGESIPAAVKGIAAISVPCHLASSAQKLKSGFNKVYMMRFMKTLKAKAYDKLNRYTNAPFTINDVKRARTFHDFDEFYTARVHGFKGAQDYWDKCSSKQFIENIKVPTLILNAQDDPFLSSQCFPIKECTANKYVELDTPKYGGHVGFIKDFKMKSTYAEDSVVKFIGSQLID
ncbi:MAG: YheT family hydrolase [Bacteroidia bacterium]